MGPIETILGKLQGVQQHGDYYTALCPGHDDNRQSLSISEGDDGRALVKCHAGCETSSILEAMGLKMGDLFPKGDGRGEIVATYDYHDAGGKLAYQVVRFKPKSFVCRRPNGAGGWLWNLDGTERVLYHLPDLLAEPGRVVFIAEGEKSVDVVRGLGLLATTNPHGAGKWNGAYSEPLRGRPVVILPDNDGAGRDHAQDVAKDLLAKASLVRVLELPNLADKEDVADWIGRGGDRAELEALANVAPMAADWLKTYHPHKKHAQTLGTAIYWDKREMPTTADYVAALASLGYSFRINDCNDMVEVNGEAMSDIKRAKIRSQMRDLNYHRVNVMEDAWIAHAYDCRYHPVRDFLEGLTWDGQEHTENLAGYFTDGFGGGFSLFLIRWLIGAVARAYERYGCQNRMLILDGDQGIGKSYFTRWLAEPTGRPELFVEGPINPDDKDDKIRLITAWIWEVSELGSTTRRSDREALKYFLSQQQVTVRKPYGHYDLVKPALSSFVGTVNNIAGFLDDPTGYRRFMTSHLTAIDWSYANEIDPRQVWAQAKAYYDRGEPWELSPEEAEFARFANSQYEIEDPLDELFTRHYEITGDPAHFVATVDIKQAMNNAGWRLNSPRTESMAIADLMRRKGIDKGRQSGERGYTGINAIGPPPLP